MLKGSAESDISIGE